MTITGLHRLTRSQEARHASAKTSFVVSDLVDGRWQSPTVPWILVTAYSTSPYNRRVNIYISDSVVSHRIIKKQDTL